ncbi:sigma-54 interaction domain-containing protein [Desulfoferula mesophila]|uniref:Sigma-54-dependent Fis family transcriptional regulator n=1 Tax=Desulfoferula mesophila TaxID=3058419 RepID=A0AAU9ENW5_9BACT|nr:sigma-54-dependent Fis family transcriptional regulator [Desulfoferula mesophilus]
MNRENEDNHVCAVERLSGSQGMAGSAMRVLSGAADLGDLVDFLALVLDNVYSGIIVCDSDCRIVFMNRVYGELLGADPKAAVGDYLDKYFPHTRMPQVLSTGRSELAQRCSLKTDMPMLVNRIPLRIKGQVVGVILQTIFRDYTAMTDLISRLQGLESEVKYYKKGLDRLLSPLYGFNNILGSSPLLAGVKAVAAKYARTEAPVLITGATGTGKEMFAHAVHRSSPRAAGPFVCVNCAAIPRELLESELFGYESGAFTGASRKGKVGQIQLAHTGTLFLDEIGELSPKAQATLLRVLETKTLERLGGVKRVAVDFRLVAATNRDLKEMMSRGEFRDDLYYRLSTMAVEIPALSRRREDVPVLVAHFLTALEHPQTEVGLQAMEALQNYAWPGNVRELKNVIERAVSLSEGRRIDLEHLPREILTSDLEERQVCENPDTTLAEQMACFEKRVMEHALAFNKGNMTKTAKMLGISRSTLYEKCRRYDLGDTEKAS